MPSDDIEEYRKDVRMLGARLAGEALVAGGLAYALHQWRRTMQLGIGRWFVLAAQGFWAGMTITPLVGAASLVILVNRMRFDESERLDVGPIATTLFGPRRHTLVANGRSYVHTSPPESVTLPWFMHDDVVSQYKAKYNIK